MKHSSAFARHCPPVTSFHGTAEPIRELLQAPASGTACVHWRLRILEFVAPGLELVHEVVSPEPLDISWRADADHLRPPSRVRLSPQGARIHALPVCFREGTSGARAVARQFGLQGTVRVEEVIIRPGEEVEAEGVLTDPAAMLSRGPFRAIDAAPELLQATLRLPTSLSLRPVLLPWALGTAAALLGSVTAATAMARWLETQVRLPSLSGGAVEMGPAKPLRPQWP